MTQSITRRRFMGSVAAVTLAANTNSLNACQPSLPKRAAALERISVAIIGCGKMANDYHIPELLKQPDVQVLGVCEVDQNRREHAKKRVEDFYSNAKQEFRGCAAVADFRELLKRDDLDAVCIATPDRDSTD